MAYEGGEWFDVAGGGSASAGDGGDVGKYESSTAPACPLPARVDASDSEWSEMSRRCGVGGLGGLPSDESSCSNGLLVGRGASRAAPPAPLTPLGRSEDERAGAGVRVLA